jgi:hypothetical protein
MRKHAFSILNGLLNIINAPKRCGWFGVGGFVGGFTFIMGGFTFFMGGLVEDSRTFLGA